MLKKVSTDHFDPVIRLGEALGSSENDAEAERFDPGTLLALIAPP